MAAANHESSTRKPSGSSTHSGAHSPSSSPNHAHNPRRVTPTTGNMFGVGMGAVKGLNSGWQVWGNATPGSTRNASISSAASGPEPSPSQTDSGYRSMGETWSNSRSTSGTWEDSTGSPQKKELSQLDPLALHARPRQVSGQPGVFSTPTSAVSKAGQFSPQRYENGLGKDANAQPRYTATSSSPFTNQQPLMQGNSPNGNYESLQTSSMVENDLSAALRGMAVEDEYGLSQQNGTYRPQASTMTGQPTIPQIRAPLVQQPRGPYGGYPQTDYANYYTDPSLYASSPALSAATAATVYPGMAQQPLHPHVTDLHVQQSGIFYDYTGSTRPPGSQFYYPTQPMVYSHTPVANAQTAGTSPDRRRDMQQYMSQQQMMPQNLMYANIRSSPSPHPQAYGTMDYAPLMLPPGAMYGHAGMSQPGMHMYQQGGRPSRRHDHNADSNAIRSPLLDEFRANKTRKWELRDIFGYVVEFSGDQHGSRFIQQKLEGATSEEKEILFDEIVPHNALQLIQDVFGNYVIQKLFEHGTQVQKTMLAKTMEGHILQLSLQMYGCRVVQKAVEYVLPDQQGVFVRELDANVLQCVKDANGNHVIQKLIERVTPERLAFVNSFRGNVFDLATHPYGCRVLQRCFEYLPEEQTRPLLDELLRFTTQLMQHSFGNYVIQFVLEKGAPQDKALIVSKLRGQMLNMARHKFASNVCEKALVYADPENQRALIDEIMAPKHDGVSPVVTMMKDQYANYVLQRALSVVEGDQKDALVSKIRPQLVSMRRYSSAYSKHLNAIERLLVEKCGVTFQEEATHHNVAVVTAA